MRMILIGVVAAVVIAGCGDDSTSGGGGGGNVNTNNAAQLFNNPDGTVTDENADEAVQKAIDATRANNSGEIAGGFGTFSIGDTSPKQFDECIDVNLSNGATVIDYACLGPELGEDCTGQGTLTSSVGSFSADGSVVVNSQYNNAGFACGGAPPFLCNGPAQTSIAGETIVTCLDLTCTVEMESERTSGCFTFDSTTGNNLVLVTLEDGSVVCIALVANSDCSQACSEWRDADGDSRIVCDVTALDGGECRADGTTITETENCVVDRTQTSCAGF